MKTIKLTVKVEIEHTKKEGCGKMEPATSTQASTVSQLKKRNDGKQQHIHRKPIYHINTEAIPHIFVTKQDQHIQSRNSMRINNIQICIYLHTSQKTPDDYIHHQHSISLASICWTVHCEWMPCSKCALVYVVYFIVFILLGKEWTQNASDSCFCTILSL